MLFERRTHCSQSDKRRDRESSLAVVVLFAYNSGHIECLLRSALVDGMHEAIRCHVLVGHVCWELYCIDQLDECGSLWNVRKPAIHLELCHVPDWTLGLNERCGVIGTRGE